MANRVELLGYPNIEWSKVGDLRRFTRFYKVLGGAVEVATLQTEVYLAPGTADAEHTGAFLVDQRVEKTGERNEELRLARVYQELGNNVLTETGEDTFQQAWDRRTIRRKVYIAKASEAEALLPAIGDQLGATGYYAFDAQIEEAGFASRVVVSYVGLAGGEFITGTSTDIDGEGVLRTTVNSIILEKDIGTLTPVSGTDETLSWTINNGVANVTRGSLSITDPIITSTRTETKFNGALTITIQTGVGPTGGAEPTWTGTGTLFESSVEVRGDVTRYRKAWADGTGEIGRDTESRFGGILTVTTVRSIGPTRVAATGEYDYSEDDRDGYTLWTSRGATGSGTIEDTTANQNGGALIIRTIRSVGVAPTAPVGAYVLVDDESEQREGFTIYRRQWAKGDGEISRVSETRNGGKLTIVRVRHLTAKTVTVNPVSSPGAGYVLIDSSTDDREGHRIWNVVYALGAGRVETSVRTQRNGKLISTTIRYLGVDDGATPSGTLTQDNAEERDGYVVTTREYVNVPGDGLVIDESQTRENGKLILYRRVRLGTAPGAPSATIAGTVVLISSDVRQDDGVAIYDYRWAEGIGTISTVSTFRYIGPLVTDTEETKRQVQSLATVPATPGGFWLQVQSSREQDGVTLYDYTFASLTVLASDTTEDRFGGTLKIRNVRSETTVSTPAGWTATETGSTTRDDGKTIYNYTFVLESDASLVSESVETRENGKLIITRRRQLETAPVAPGASIGGTVVLIDDQSRVENGYTIFDRTWAEGIGTISSQSTFRYIGPLVTDTEETKRLVTALGAAPATPGGFWLQVQSSREENGVTIYDYTFASLVTIASDTTEDRFGGTLRIRNVRSETVVSTPAGWTATESGSTVREDGKTIYNYTFVFEDDVSLVSETVETKQKGKLVITRRRQLETAPAAPSPSIGGTVLLIDDQSREDSGHTIFDRTWVEGVGTIDTESTFSQDTTERRRRVRALGAAPTEPVGFWTQSQRTLEQDGVTLYDYVFIADSTLSSDTTVTRQGGALQIRDVRSESTVSTPVNWTAVESGITTREDGKVIYNYRFVLESDAAFVFESVETRQGGKLIITRRRQLETAPLAPAAALGGTVVLVDDQSNEEDGFTVYDRTWAEGKGEISSESSYRDTGAGTEEIRRRVQTLGSAPATPGGFWIQILRTQEQEGTTLYDYTFRLTVATNRDTTRTQLGGTLLIRDVDSESVVSEPVGWTTVESGTTLRDDGRTIYNYRFVFQDDALLVSETTDTREGGKLIITRRRQLETAPSAPAAAIAGTVTLIDERQEEQDGYTVFDRTWAEGIGETSRDTETRNGGKLTVVRIEHLTAVATAIQPTSTPGAGYVLIDERRVDRDGYRLWSVIWALGSGRVSTETETLQGGKLTRTTIRFLETDDGGTPSGTLIKDTSVEEASHSVVTRVYVAVVGDGIVLTETQSRDGGKLTLTRIQRLGTVPDTPVGGFLVSSESREIDGVTLYNYLWAEGAGEVARSTDFLASDDAGTTGITRTTVRHLTASGVGTDPTSVAGSVKISSSYADQDGHRLWTAVYAKGTGEISRAEEPGPIPGTTRIIVTSLGAAIAGAGVLIGQSETTQDGFVRYVRETLDGTIVGDKQTYADVVDVIVPGTVDLVAESITAGGLSGTVAVVHVTPPRRLTVKADVTVSITTTPPVAATVAYDIGQISCSVTALRAAYNFRGYDSGQTRDGSIQLSFPRRAANISASVQTYPGCYLLATTATGGFAYQAGAQYFLSSGGTFLSEVVFDSNETTKLTGTGSTSATGYVTTGVLRRRSRPILTDLAGTIYYEVITWTV